MIANDLSLLSHVTASCWRQQCSPVQWLTRVAAAAPTTPPAVRATLLADALHSALFLVDTPAASSSSAAAAAAPSAVLAAYAEHGLACGAVCVDTTLQLLAPCAARAAPSDALDVMLTALRRVAPVLGRVRDDRDDNDDHDDDDNSVARRLAARTRALAALLAALLASGCAAWIEAAVALADDRSVAVLLAAAAQTEAPEARAALLRVLPRDSLLRRLWLVRDDADLDADVEDVSSSSSVRRWQPLAGRAALSELREAASLLHAGAQMSWRQRAPPAVLSFVLDRLLCRIVCSDEPPLALIGADLRAAFALAHVPLATFYSYLLERLFDWYHKSPAVHVLSLVLDVVDAVCALGDVHARVLLDAARCTFVASPPPPPSASPAADLRRFVDAELALMAASAHLVDLSAVSAVPSFEPTRAWFHAAHAASERGEPLATPLVDAWLHWLDGGGVAQLPFDDARVAQMALLSCVAADSSRRAAIADAIVREARGACELATASSGVMLALLANAPADSMLHELLRQQGRFRALAEALLDVCDALGGQSVVADAHDGSGKRRRADASAILTRFSDAFLLLYRLEARVVDDGFSGSFVMVRGAARWHATLLGRAAPATPVNAAVWARATDGFHALYWQPNDTVDAAVLALAAEATVALIEFLGASDGGSSLPPLSPWAALLAVPTVMEHCIVQLALDRNVMTRLATRLDLLVNQCPCLMPSVAAWLADAALIRSNHWMPLVVDGEQTHDQKTGQTRVVSPQARLLGELNAFYVPQLQAAIAVLATSAIGAQVRRLSMQFATRPLVRVRQRLEEVQSMVQAVACGRRGLLPAQSVAAGKATAGVEPVVIRLFFQWLTPRADFGARWVRVGWVGDLLFSCRAVTRGSSARVLADFLAAELVRVALSPQCTGRLQLAWLTDVFGCVLGSLAHDALLDWLADSLPALVDKCPSQAAVPVLARAVVVACALADSDALSTAACSALARAAVGSFRQLTFGHALVREFAFGGRVGALQHCDAAARAMLVRGALAARLGLATTCRLMAADDALSARTESDDATLRRTLTLIHCCSGDAD